MVHYIWCIILQKDYPQIKKAYFLQIFHLLLHDTIFFHFRKMGIRPLFWCLKWTCPKFTSETIKHVQKESSQIKCKSSVWGWQGEQPLPNLLFKTQTTSPGYNYSFKRKCMVPWGNLFIVKDTSPNEKNIPFFALTTAAM